MEVGGERAVKLLGSCNDLFATVILCTIPFLEGRVYCIPLRTCAVGVEVIGKGFHPLHSGMLSGCITPGAAIDKGWGSRGRRGLCESHDGWR